MTELTGCGRVQVADILTGSTDTVVAAFTIVTDAGVGEIGDLPAIGGVAKVAGLKGNDMGCGFTGSTDSVVAGLTSAADHIRVVEKDQQPALGDMTGIARIVCGDVAGMLARRDIAVVAAFAGAGDLGVVYVTDPRPTEG